MKRLWIILVCLLLPAAAHAQLVNFQNNCEVGGKKVTTQGMQSASFFEQSYPGCVVTVYAHGTTNLSTIYADSSSTPLSNPFTASTTTGNFIFWANSGVYDVVISGGQPTPGLTIPFTYVAGLAQGGGGGGGQTANPVVVFSNVTSVTLLGASYGFTTNGFVWDCYDSNNHSLEPQDAKPSVGPPPTYNFTVYFNQPQSGYCTANSNNGGSGTYVNPILSVVTYGAKGDGVTDDTAAINAAMTACTVTRTFPYNGCTLYFPSGIYITTGLTWLSYMHGKGDGWATSVIQLKPNTNGDVITIPQSTFNFSLYGLTFDGNSGNGSTGNCLTVGTSPSGPNAINTANKQPFSANGYRFGHIEEVMFSNCSVNGLNINLFNYDLLFDNIYVYNNGVYGINASGDNDNFSNFISEHNGASGVYVTGSNNRFSNAQVNFSCVSNQTHGAIYDNAGFRNLFDTIHVEDSYCSGFEDNGNDDIWTGDISDSNGYAPGNNNASSLTASGFIIIGVGGTFIGDKVTSYRGLLPDGNYTTEWPYTIVNTAVSRIDITYDSTNKPPPTVAATIGFFQNQAFMPPTATASAGTTTATSIPLYFRGSFWNGTAAVNNDWQLYNQPGFNQLVANPPPSANGPSSTPAFLLNRLGDATSTSGNFNSPDLSFLSTVWNGTAEVFPEWNIQATVGTGTSPSPVLSITPVNLTGLSAAHLQINTDIATTGQITAVGPLTAGANSSWGSGSTIPSSNSVPQISGTPTSGKAACIKSTGPPLLIGYCSTQPDSTGSCTCN